MMSLMQWLTIFTLVAVVTNVSDARKVEDMCSSLDCQPGQQCVSDLEIGARCVCRLDTDCPAASRPLCASDGKIYKNSCVMKATACREGRRIRRMKGGTCLPSNACELKPTSPCRAYFPRFYYNTTTRQCHKFVAGGCHPSGWDGFYTKKECKSQCLDVCKTTNCPTGEKCVQDATTGRATCVCRLNSDCPASLDVLCGSDGKFYNNTCIMEATGCREGRNITETAAGKCRPDNACDIKPTSPCRGYFPRFYYNTTIKKCERFIAGGCHRSGWDGFETEEECRSSCAGKGGLSCPLCRQPKLPKACRDSSLLVIGQVTAQLEGANKLNRYILDIQQVLKISTFSLPEGKAVFSVPYEDSPDCACPKLPLNRKVLIGSSAVQRRKKSSVKTGITLSGEVFVFEWSRKVASAKCVTPLNAD